MMLQAQLLRYLSLNSWRGKQECKLKVWELLTGSLQNVAGLLLLSLYGKQTSCTVPSSRNLFTSSVTTIRATGELCPTMEVFNSMSSTYWSLLHLHLYRMNGSDWSVGGIYRWKSLGPSV